MGYVKTIGLAILAATWVSVTAPAVAQTPIDVVRHDPPSRDGIWRTTGGTVSLLLDADRLRDLGFELQTIEKTGISDELPSAEATFSIRHEPNRGILFASRNGRFSALAGGSAPTDGEMLLVRADGETFDIGDFDFHVTIDASGSGTGTVTDRRGTSREAFRFSGGLIQFDAATGRFEWGGADLSLDSNWAHEVSLSAAGGQLVGTLLIEAVATPAPDAMPPSPPPGEHDGPDSFALAGPDVIVGDLQDTSRYGSVGGITAFSVGTTSCNIGSQGIEWNSINNQHPVIAQNMYRLKSGRFEQIGMSWLKHGFFAESESLCFGDCQVTDGSTLGVHCSDPYNSSLNGDQANLGPRWQVNAATGNFTYPPANPNTPATIGRRLQVHNVDLDPGQNAGALYFVEGHYITPDDAAAGNGDNNASYRQILVTGTPGSGTYDIALTATTQRQDAAIRAWRDNDASVTLVNVDVPSDGRMTLGYEVTDNGNGTWHYEWALHNMDSDRSGQSFSIPVANGVNLTNVGFHDVDYHSNDGIGNVTIDGTDWTFTHASGVATWTTQSFAQNPNANALRWGTLYNFRFDADVPPIPGEATVGLFKPGSPSSVTVATRVPTDGSPCDDQSPPVITCPSNRTAEATSASGASVSFTPTATDDCTLVPTIDCVPPSGSTFALGTSTVNCTATDAASRSSSCSFTVTVRDTTPPALTCGNLVRECTSASGANVSYSVIATDAVDPSPTTSCAPASGSLFPFGTTTVNCTSTDHATPPNSSSCAFTVTVRDTTAPAIQCPVDVTTDCSTNDGIVTFSVTVSDACDPSPTVICNPPSGSPFPLGATTVTCTATDASDNSSNCSFHVTVSGPLPCFPGTVDTGVGPPRDVLFVNGSAGTGCVPTVVVGVRAPITVHMDEAPAGSSNGEYVLWVWRGAAPFTPRDLVLGGQTTGCTVKPTPFDSSLSPQPFRCVRGGLPAAFCGATQERNGSPRAPWSITRSQGLRRPLDLTLQGVLADPHAATTAGTSVTNAVVIAVR
ncbi:MAG: HYR domain-containing protein [Planctomycetes bacterium]|nr:HYR domain-containing protein [Planctomycetota bacterium]